VKRETGVRRASYPVHPESLPPGEIREEHYCVRFASSLDELDAVLRLRYEVFNLELGEGLDVSHATGRDEDEFDAACHHLLVIDDAHGGVVGTYRVQTAAMAARHRGFYSAGEFVLETLPDEIVDQAVEVGRACVSRPYRNRHVLFLLWKGLGAYLTWNRKRYLFGCCSLTSQDNAEGHRVLRHLEREGHVHPSLRVEARAGWECSGGWEGDPGEVVVPPLFKIYLRYGAKVCSPPVLDRFFKTIDFLVVLDVNGLEPDAYRTFLHSGGGSR